MVVHSSLGHGRGLLIGICYVFVLMQVAMARKIQLPAAAALDVDRTLGSERLRLEAAMPKVRSKFDAVRLLHDVAQRYRAWRS